MDADSGASVGAAALDESHQVEWHVYFLVREADDEVAWRQLADFGLLLLPELLLVPQRFDVFHGGNPRRGIAGRSELVREPKVDGAVTDLGGLDRRIELPKW